MSVSKTETETRKMLDVQSGRNYMFRRDFNSAMRQNLNHFTMKSLTGWLLHPAIKCPEDGLVADVACGTAIWLQELGNDLPSPARLTGFDISSAMFPAKAWRQPNLTLLHHDMFRPFPDDHLGKYDVVNVRFLKCIVSDAELEGVLRNIIGLLKPGGYLQWFDGMSLQSKVYSNNPDAPTEASERLAVLSISPNSKATFKWTGQLHEKFSAQGLEVVAKEQLELTKAYYHVWAMSTLSTVDDIEDPKKDDDKAGYINNLIKALSEEIDQGVVMKAPWACVVGRKK